MASNKYFYQVLGVQSNASQDEIKQAFHQLAHKYHPDISTEPNAEQKFQDINEAYTALRNQKPVDKKRSKLPIIAAVTGITSLVAIIIFFYQNSFNTQEIQTGILNSNLEAIQSLENANINFAKKVISGTGVKVALIDFYLKNPPFWKKLDSYHHSIRTEILKDDQVYRRLRDHYYHQIDNEIKEDKFKKALPLLGEIKKAYPDKSELYSKYQQIQEKKQQRLAALTQKYMDCLYKTWMPLLERTHCMAAARDTIETVGIEHDLPIDSNLPAMYAKEVRLALKDQNYDHADDILLDWGKLLPANSEQRDVLKDILYLRRERENIVADLSGNDKMQIAKRLHQLSADPVLQQQVLDIAKVKNNLLKYNFNELLTIIVSNYGDISPSHESKLREILELPEEVENEDKTTQVASDSSSGTPITPITAITAITAITPIIPIAIPTLSTTEEVKNNNEPDRLLTKCQQYYNKNYLTRGRNTALSCYRQVLNIDPNNNQALDGINNIENKYYLWADSALRKKKFGRVKYYIQALQKFNSNSSRLTGLKEKLNAAQRQTVAQANQATKAKEAARLARLKASKEKAVKEREARLKAATERASKRRAARYKVAKAKLAKEKAAKRKVARAKVVQERAAKRKVARQNAAKERAAKRKVARAKAAKERAAKRKLARAKAAKERAAKRKVARQNAAKERAAKRKAARQNAAKERAAKRKLARTKAAKQRAAKRKIARQNAAKERVAKRKVARAKAANERAAKRKIARAKAAKQRAAKRQVSRQNAIKAARIKAVRKAARRKIAKEKAAKESAARRKAARAKAANQRAAKRKAARAKAANQRAAKRKLARAKAANQRAAKRKVARAKAANQRAAKRKLARAKAAKERSAKRRKAARERAIKAKAAKRKAAKKKAAKRKKIAKRKRGGSCSRLVKQMSIGVKALTRGQRAYFRRNCR